MNSMKVVADDRGEELLGHPLELVFEDGLCTPEGGATAAQKLAADTTIVGLIGSACSDETVGGIAALTNAGLTQSRRPIRARP
jgi:branched-chain amino acid transport system substrate-binding protein